MFEKLYPVALEAGIDAMRFWDMTVFEIREHIKAHIKRRKEEMRETAIHFYNHAYLLVQMIGKMLSGEGEIPSLHEMYPALFDAPLPAQQDWRIMKERIEAYSIEMKMRKRGEQSGGDQGDND